MTLFGTAKNLAAEAEQGSVEQGGTVFVVLTVTDAAGNPVSGAQPGPARRKSSVRTMTRTTSRPSQASTLDDEDAGTYNVNKDVDGDGASTRAKISRPVVP